MSQKGLITPIVAIVILIIVVVIFLFLARPFKTPENAIPPFKGGELLLAEKMSYFFNDPKVGDRILFIPKDLVMEYVGVITNINEDNNIKTYVVVSTGTGQPWVITEDKIIWKIYFPSVSKEDISNLLTTQTSEVDEIADWATYTFNNEFYFKYPSNSKLTEGGFYSVDGVFVPHPDGISLTAPVDKEEVKTLGMDGFQLKIFIEDNKEGQTLSDLKQEISPDEISSDIDWYSPDLDWSGLKIQDTTVDNNPAIKGNTSGPYGSYTIITIYKKKIYKFVFEPTISKTGEQILSTFKFLDTSVTATSKPLSISTPYKVISSDEISPDQKYVIGQDQTGDYSTIEVARHNAGTANYITTDLVKENENVIGYGTKFRCQCGTSFKGWYANDKFIITILNALGEEYEYIVSISDSLSEAKVNEHSLRRIK